MKKLFSLIGMIALLIPLLAACGGSSPSNGPVTLRYGIWDKNQAPAMQQIINEFQKAHPNITVKLEVTPSAGNAYWQKLQTAVTGGGAPDVFWMNGPHIVQYASNNVIMPIDKQIADDKVDLGNYPSSLVSLYTYNGKHYALPKDFDTIGLWYNKTLFDAAGVKYPDGTWNWTTLEDAAKKLTNPAKGTWGIAAAMDSQENYYNTIYQNGGYVISPDKKKSGYDDPASIGGLKIWVDMIQNKWSPTLAQMTDTPPTTLFESGKVAMLYAGSWMAIEFAQNQYTRDKVDVTVMPQGKQRATVIHGLGNVISASTQHPAEAWQFVNFLGTQRVAQIQADTGTVIPAYNGTQQAWVKAFPQFHLQSYIDELAYAVPYPVSKNTAAWNDDEGKVLTDVWSGKTSVDAGAKLLAQEMNQVLAKEQQQ